MSTSTTTRRVVEPALRAGRLHLPDQWLRALVAGAEAAVLSWLVVVVPAIATYVATASSPALGSAHWVGAARVGTAAWLLGHGAAPALESATISVVPLGITMLCFAILVGSLRRARLASWSAGAFAGLAYLGFTTAFVAFAATPGTSRALVGAAVLAAVALPCGLRGSAPSWWRRTVAGAPDWLADGAGLAWRILAVHLALATVATIAMILTHLDRVGELRSDLAADGLGSVVLILAQLLALPTLIVWAAAYLLGPGFALGSGTTFAPDGIVAGPLPVVPVLGALPEPDSLVGDLPVLGLTGVVTGLIAGVWMVRRLRRRSAWRMVLSLLGGTVVAAAVLAGLAGLASGSLGPGVMSHAGANAWATAVALGWQAGLGAAVVIVLAHPVTTHLVARLRSGAGVWWQQVRG